MSWIIRNIIAWSPTYLLLSSFALTFGISIYFLIVYIWTNWRRIGMAWFLIYSVLLHFGFNIIYVFLDANIGFFVILTILYLLITPLAVLIRNRTVRTF
jgi:abortive infection protein